MKKIICIICFVILCVFLIFMGVDWNGNNVIHEELVSVEKQFDLIATASTKYNSSKKRQKNIQIATAEINGRIIQPLEIFSFNQILGERTEEKGYLPAPSFLKKDGKVVTIETVGGGICQVSSTLYMAVKEAGLEIIERHPHSKRVSYCKKEEEAMVSYGTSDFVFKNKFNYPVKIEFVITEVNDSNTKILICNVYSCD